MRCWSVFLVLLVLSTSPPAAVPETSRPRAREDDVADRAGPATASELLKALSAVEGLETAFVERTKSPLLAKARARSGRLYYLQGGYLAQVELEPRSTVVMITPEELRMIDGDRVERLDLRQHPDMRLVVRALAQVWTGDEAALRETFEIEYETSTVAPAPRAPDEETDDEEDGGGDAEPAAGTVAWKMALIPKGERLQALLTSLTLEGRGFVVQKIERTSTRGTVTTTEITEANPKRRFTAEEKERLFGIEPGR